MWRTGEVRQERGELEACRQVLSIRARLHRAPVCRRSWTLGMDRFPNLVAPHGRVQESSTRVVSLVSTEPDTETLSLTKMNETAETQGHGSGATLICENKEEGEISWPVVPQIEVRNDHITSTIIEDAAKQVENMQRCRQTEQDFLPRTMKSVGYAVLGEEEHYDVKASEATLGLTRRLSGAEVLSRKEVMVMLERLYRDHPGAVWRKASREAIETAETRGHEERLKFLIYGEMSFIAFARLLETYVPIIASARPRSTDSKKEQALSSSGFTFYDLGCGAGRPVFMTSLLMTSCVKSCGIEIIPSMHHMNKELLQLYSTEIWKWLHPTKQAQSISFVCGDLLQVDWSDADIVLANATCFDDTLIENLEARAEKILKEGAVVIVVTKRFKNDTVWELVDQTERRMSWSSAVASVYRKKSIHKLI